jgi:hypothetical protein
MFSLLCFTLSLLHSCCLGSRAHVGTSAAAKSGGTNSSATAICSDRFLFLVRNHEQDCLTFSSTLAICSDRFLFLLRNHEQDCLTFSCILVLSERFSDWQLCGHLPADAEGKVFAKDFVETSAPDSSKTRHAMPDIEDAEKVSLKSQYCKAPSLHRSIKALLRWAARASADDTHVATTQ